MAINDNSFRNIKIGEKEIVIRNNNDIRLDNLHIIEELNLFTDGYDKNGDSKISTKSYSSIFLNDINELIGDDNKITDDEIESYIQKNGSFLKVNDIKSTLIELFSLKNNPNFKPSKNDNGENRIVKIGDTKICIGKNLVESADLSKYCTKGYCDNQFLHNYINYDTKKIDSKSEAEQLYKIIESLCNENNEITDEAITEYVSKTPSLKGFDPSWLKEFFIQAFPVPKTEEEKQEYFSANETRIKKITNSVNLMNTSSDNELVNIAKEIVQDFRREYGQPESSTMQMLIQKEYYQNDPRLHEAIVMCRNGSEQELGEFVKKTGVANCQEDAILTKQLLQEKYPSIKFKDVDFRAENGLGDTVHTAIMIYPDNIEEKFSDYSYKFDKNNNNIDQFNEAYVIDNWFGGVYRAGDWIKMQKLLHKEDNVEITVN